MFLDQAVNQTLFFIEIEVVLMYKYKWNDLIDFANEIRILYVTFNIDLSHCSYVNLAFFTVDYGFCLNLFIFKQKCPNIYA